MILKTIQGGLFIVVDGPDGSGKTTQAELIRDYISEKGYKVIQTIEPGSPHCPECIEIRKWLQDPSIPKTHFQELEKYLLDRSIHTKEFMEPKLKENNIIICGRWVHATEVYQGYAGTIDISYIQQENRKITKKIMPRLKLSIFYDVSYETAMKRIRGERENLSWMEQKGKRFFKKVEEGYRFLYENQKPPKRIYLIDGEPPAEKVWEKTRSLLEEKLKIS